MISSETFHWMRGGVSGGTVSSGFVMAEMDKSRLKRGGGEFALCMREYFSQRSSGRLFVLDHGTTQGMLNRV